jgi:hypothetical protein
MNGDGVEADMILRTQRPVVHMVVIFKNGRPEEWIKWLMGCRDIETSMPLMNPLKKTKMTGKLLKGRPQY